MEANWITGHWLDLVQSIGIVGGLLFSAYTTRKDERARRISNSIAINEQYRDIWKEMYDRPELSRVLSKDANVEQMPVSRQEELFVTTLILHLSTVYRAIKHGEFVKLEGLQKDVEAFFSLPIPQAVWRKIKPLQDRNFVRFIEEILAAP
jgi:hypothetical protein